MIMDNVQWIMDNEKNVNLSFNYQLSIINYQFKEEI
jgi:hypothetical protein